MAPTIQSCDCPVVEVTYATRDPSGEMDGLEMPLTLRKRTISGFGSPARPISTASGLGMSCGSGVYFGACALLGKENKNTQQESANIFLTCFLLSRVRRLQALKTFLG